MLLPVTCPMGWLMKNRVALAAALLVVAQLCHGLPALQRLPKIYTTDDGIRFQVELVASGLLVPSDLAFTPAGGLIITERPGRLSLLTPTGELDELDQLYQVHARDEAGLMGMALNSVSRDQLFIYLCYSARKGMFGIENRLVKAMLGRFGLLQEEVLLSWPGHRFNNGCQLAIGPDQKLYISTGDATEGEVAQQHDSLLGKMLRLNLNGSIPADNPRPDSPIYSMGHQNLQGFDWQPSTDRLYAVERGRSGDDDSDELNLIEGGANYGWPLASHGQLQPGMVVPLLFWPKPMGPAGVVVYQGGQLPGMSTNLFITGLTGETLLRVVLDVRGQPVAQEELLKGEFGRLRAITQGPDGYLYFATSNLDGEGEPGVDGDLLLRLVPAE